MSSVRICDKCFTVFSENEDGWQTFTATTTKIGEDGEAKQVNQRMDACPSCALIPKRQFQAELQAHSNGDALQERIAKLERETGIAQPQEASTA